MEEETGAGSMPGFVLPIVPIMLVAVVFLVLRARRKSNENRAFSRISSVIDDSALPDRAKEILLRGVDEARGVVPSIREMASEVHG